MGLGTLRLDPDNNTIAFAQREVQSLEARGIPLQPAGPQVVLLPVFDGLGTARIALQDALNLIGEGAALAAADFAESDDILAPAFEQKHWSTKACFGIQPYRKATKVLWDLMRNRAAALSRVLATTPRNALMLIIAGSPCEQLTTAGAYQGKQGLCGPDSILMYAIPIIARAAQDLRPDLQANVMIETATSAQPRHNMAMLEALGIPLEEEGRHILHVDTKGWTAPPRNHLLLLSRIPVGPKEESTRWNPHRRADPWGKG